MDEAPETDDGLIARVKKPADAQSWTEFAAVDRPVVVRMAIRRGLQPTDAQDVAQEVMLSVSRSIDRWEPRHSRQPFRAWLGTLAKNAILNALTRRRPDRGTGLSAVADRLNEVADDDPETTAELRLETQRELFRRVAQQIRGDFAPATWRMFWETEVNGRSVADVAVMLGRSAGAVYLARCRVMKRLREQAQAAMAGWGVEKR